MANDINKEDPHYKGEYGSIYEVNRKFPTGGVAGDFVVIYGWAHYWNAVRGTWCVNAERDSYWDELITNIIEKFKLVRGATYLGVANLDTVPTKVIGAKMYYFATVAGTYKNFDNLVVPQGINVLYSENGSSWVNTTLLEVAQELGVSTNKVVSQKAVSDKLSDLSKYFNDKFSDLNVELTKKFNSENITQGSGDSEDKVMSQKAVTEALADTIKDKYILEVIMPRLEYKKAIGTDGSIINASQNYNNTFYVTDFVEIKAGQKFIIENGYAVKGTNIIAIYSKEDKSYIEGIEGLGKTMTAEYTAKSDVYVRIGNNSANNLGINCKTYMSFETTSKKSDIFKTEVVDVVEIQVGIVTHTGDRSLSFSKRSQDRMALVNVDGSNILRITPRGSNGCSFAMLNSYTPPTSSSEFPDYVNKVVFNVNAGKSVLFDVSKAKYLAFVSATDVNPNTLPVEVSYLVSNEKSLITENTNSLLYEPPYQNIKVTKGTYTESERFDVEGAERVTFNLYAFGTRASKFLDADGTVLKKWGYGNTEGWFEGETTVPKKAKYLVYRTKYTSLEAYIHVYYKKQMSAQKINDELSSIRELTANAGYHYLADAYGVTTSNEDNTEKLQALIDTVNKNGGGIIEIGCGTFTFKNSVTLKSNVGIMGQGIGNTILKMLDGGSTTNYALFNGDFIKNVFIRDIEINSTGTNTTGKHLFMRYIEDSYFTHIKSVDSRPTAIGIDFLNHVTITDNIIINGGRSKNIFGNACIGIGTGYDKWENEDFVISNNICINGGQRGIFVEDQARFGGTKKMNAGYGQVICGNIVRGGYRGITVEAGKRINISGNTIYGTQIGMGVKVYADDCLFQGNLLVDNNTGIIVDDLSATFVDNNNIAFIDNIIKGGTTGIHVKSDGLIRDLTIKNNVIKNYTNGCKITGGVKTLVLQGNNDFSTAISYLLGGEFSNAIIKDNTFTVAPTKEGETSFSGSTQWVEQMN
jgi:hypothetical protein